MNRKSGSVGAFGFGAAFLLIGLLLVVAITPSPAETMWMYLLPPTLPGLLIWIGILSIGIGAYLRHTHHENRRASSIR